MKKKSKASKTKIEVNLPQLLTFSDYHDIDYLKEKLEQIIPDIQAEELGCAGPKGGADYYGLFYIKQDDDYDKCVEEYNEIEAEWAEEE